MDPLQKILDDNRLSVSRLAEAAERCAATWDLPPRPGKWTPSQITEHVARSLEESANVVDGKPSKFPNFPGFLRVIARNLLVKRVLKRDAFPKAKTSQPFNPDRGSATPAEGRARLEAAAAAFERACRERAAKSDTVETGTFGTLALAEYARFQEIHVRHHTRQMPRG